MLARLDVRHTKFEKSQKKYDRDDYLPFDPPSRESQRTRRREDSVIDTLS